MVSASLMFPFLIASIKLITDSFSELKEKKDRNSDTDKIKDRKEKREMGEEEMWGDLCGDFGGICVGILGGFPEHTPCKQRDHRAQHYSVGKNLIY